MNIFNLKPFPNNPVNYTLPQCHPCISGEYQEEINAWSYNNLLSNHQSY